MKSIQLYVCEHCGTKYKDKNECKKCESNHRAALEIHDMRFHACKDSDNYPDKVELKMADGKRIFRFEARQARGHPFRRVEK